MKHLDKKKYYGEIPEDFKNSLRSALQAEPEQHLSRKLSPTLVIALCLILVSGIALAVAQGVGLIDIFGIGSVNHKRSQQSIVTEVTQHGGKTSIAAFEVAESYYDGRFLRFMVTVQPEDNISLIDARDITETWSEDSTNAYGVSMSVSTDGDNESIVVFSRMLEGELRFFTYANVTQSMADSLCVSIAINIENTNGHDIIEEAHITYHASKTTSSLASEFDISTVTDVVEVCSVRQEQTPFETVLSVDYRPILKAFGGFSVVPSDGYIRKNNEDFYFGSIGTLWETTDGIGTIEYILPYEFDAEPQLTLWVSGTSQAIVLDKSTGEVSLVSVDIIKTDSDIQINTKEK